MSALVEAGSNQASCRTPGLAGTGSDARARHVGPQPASRRRQRTPAGRERLTRFDLRKVMPPTRSQPLGRAGGRPRLVCGPNLGGCLSGVGPVVGWEISLPEIFEGRIVHPWVPEFCRGANDVRRCRSLPSRSPILVTAPARPSGPERHVLSGRQQRPCSAHDLRGSGLGLRVSAPDRRRAASHSAR